MSRMLNVSAGKQFDDEEFDVVESSVISLEEGLSANSGTTTNKESHASAPPVQRKEETGQQIHM